MTEDESEECGVGIRGVALAVDSGVWFALLFAAVYAVGFVTGDLRVTGASADAELSGFPAQVAFLLWLALAIEYHVLMEYRYGQTVGKYLVAVRVVADDGGTPTLRAAAVRNVFRLVDVLPAFYLVGIVSILASDRKKRLGDRVADTVVVRA
ncbi:RDD family protein [Salarchaeum japonicum]|uniref:RDD domain-containing protein n=1 Tax=Salarchaeum japonicum TaxID=555573 RepID=A0AAV3T0A5_9EURY|nr:RDD family protein [Salarchaeum japonicum]